MLFVVISFISLALLGLKKKSQIGCDEYVVDCQQSKCLKGICAVEIMLGHIGLAVHSPYLFPFRKAGILVVGIFFFLSGYGLNIKFQAVHSFGRKYLIRKIAGLIIALLTSNLVYMVVNFGVFHMKYTLYEMVSTVIGVGLINYPAWYLYELIIFYILFAFLTKYARQHTVKMLISIISLATCIGFFAGIGSPWYGSAFCFVLGIFCNCKELKLKTIFGSSPLRHYLALIASTTTMAMGMLGFFVLGEESFLGDVLCRNVASVSFSTFLYLFLFKWEVKGRLYMWLNSLAIYIYLYHMLIINMFQEIEWFSKNEILYAVAVLIGSVLLAQIIMTLQRGTKKIYYNMRIWGLSRKE